jgi:hypothetical protein
MKYCPYISVFGEDARNSIDHKWLSEVVGGDANNSGVVDTAEKQS